MRTERARARRGGFTLVELLVAIMLVLIFGAMAAALMRQGTGLWRSGHRRSYAYETATTVFHHLERDLGAAKSQFWNTDLDAYDPRIQFHVDLDEPPDTIARGPQQRLRFVRAIPEDTLNPRLRQAGNGVDDDNDDPEDIDEEYYNQKDDDGDGRIDEDLMPLEGMCEAAYLMGLGRGDQHTLYRGVLAPIGLRPGADQPGHTFFDDDAFASAQRIEGKAVALTEDVVLHFELRLWSQYTTTWDATVGFGPWPSSYEMQPCGPAFFWDSRGLRKAEDEWRDNIFPRALMAVVVVEPPQRLRAPGRLRLREQIGPHDLRIPVTGELPAYNPSWPYILLRNPDYGDEWIRFRTFDEADQSFRLDPNDPLGTRGVRWTWSHGHDAGTEVLFGYTLSSVFHNPTGRDYWGQ